MDQLLAVFEVGSVGLLAYAVLAKAPASARWLWLVLAVLAIAAIGYVGYAVVTGDDLRSMDVRFAVLPFFGIFSGWYYFRKKSEEESAGSRT